MSSERSGWHFHPRMYPNEAWADRGCPDVRSAVPLSTDDARVIRAAALTPTSPDDERGA